MIRRKLLIMSALLLAVLSVIGVCGCTPGGEEGDGWSFSEIGNAVSVNLFGEPEQEYTQIVISLPRHPGYAPIEDKHGYAALSSDEEREAYRSMEESLFRLTSEDGGRYGKYQLARACIPDLDSVSVFKVKEALRADYPEAFWLCADYSLGSNLHDGLYIILYSCMSAEQIERGAETLNRKINAMFREIPSGKTEYERELIIHDIIVRDVEYDEAAADNMDIAPEAATVYGAFVEGRAVCTGYSFAAKMMLNRVGISCMIVDGIVREIPDSGHMWNLVRIGKEWYHLDVTNDDPLQYSKSNIRSYHYFNLTDSAISVTHKIAPNFSMLNESTIQWGEDAVNSYNFPLPACDSDKANFYKLNAVSISQLNDDGHAALTDIFRRMSLDGEDSCYLVFPGDMQSDVVQEWLIGVLRSDIGTVNRENISAGTGYCINNGVVSQGASVMWCNAFTVKFEYDQQPTSTQ